MIRQVSEGFGQHHKLKAATLHVVPEYDETGDAPSASGVASSASASTGPLPIPRARQAFVPGARGSGDSVDSILSGGLPLPSSSPSINPAAHYAAARWSAPLKPSPLGSQAAFDALHHLVVCSRK
jgi:hypothetical protein